MPLSFSHPSLQAAIRHLERTDAVTLARQAELSALPAPTGSEGRRAARVAELFREVGLRDVFVDEVGNVHGWYGDASGEAAVVVAAHLDTAFGGDGTASPTAARAATPGRRSASRIRRPRWGAPCSGSQSCRSPPSRGPRVP